MKRFTILILLLIQIVLAGKLKVVTSIPDIADMVSQIGGDKVKVTSLATGKEDLHAVPARPSFLPLLNKADLLFTLGLDAEHAWLPALAKRARNPKIMEGKSGWITLSEGVNILEVPEVLSRSEGEQHRDGNPHFNIGPQAGVIMAENISKALCNADSENAAYYKKNLATLKTSIESVVKELKERGASLKGKKIITYHEDVAYICDFYGLEKVGAIEVKPGVPPTASHLKQLQDEASGLSVELIIHNQSQAEKLPQKLGKELQASVAEIANAVGAKPEITSWIELQRYNLKALLEALGE